VNQDFQFGLLVAINSTSNHSGWSGSLILQPSPASPTAHGGAGRASSACWKPGSASVQATSHTPLRPTSFLRTVCFPAVARYPKGIGRASIRRTMLPSCPRVSRRKLIRNGSAGTPKLMPPPGRISSEEFGLGASNQSQNRNNRMKRALCLAISTHPFRPRPVYRRSVVRDGRDNHGQFFTSLRSALKVPETRNVP